MTPANRRELLGVVTARRRVRSVERYDLTLYEPGTVEQNPIATLEFTVGAYSGQLPAVGDRFTVTIEREAAT